MNGKTIRIHLVNGQPSELLTAEIINWTGKIIVAPRAMLAELAKREEVKRTGVYCLLGPDPENPARDKVYVGEGDNVFKRLTAHDDDESKEFWVRCAVIISKDQNITKSHGRYIESRLITLAEEADRATIHNGTAPPIPPLPEPDIADMEYFISQMQLVLPILGFSFLQAKPVIQPGATGVTTDVSPIFTYSPSGASAKAQEINGEFVVFKGSTARLVGPQGWTSYRGLRDQLLMEKKLVPADNPEFLVFTEDVSFASPTAGAVIVNAGQVSGRTASWKIQGTAKTYHEWYEEKLAVAAKQSDQDDE